MKLEFTIREIAMSWWNDLPKSTQIKHWFSYRESNFTMSKGPTELTGSEIEKIYNKNK